MAEMLPDDLKLPDQLKLTAEPLTRDVQRELCHEARDRLSEVDPMLAQVAEITIVRNQRKNFLNIRIRKDYISMLFSTQKEGVHYCFFLPDKLEPFVTITAVHPTDGKLQRLDTAQAECLNSAIQEFKAKFGIHSESYHYTSLTERQETDQYARGGGVGASMKAHSSHFHLKMRVATGMCKERMPVLRMFDLDKARQMLEPVRYTYSRETISYEDVMKLIRRDAALPY